MSHKSPPSTPAASALGEHTRARLAAVDGVLFDMDGTLLASHEFSVDAAIDAFAELTAARGLDATPPSRQHIQLAIGLPCFDFYRAILPADLAHLADDYHTLIYQREVDALTSGRARLYRGALDTLAELQRRGFAVGCVSNASGEYFRAALQHMRLAEHFAVALCIGETGNAKPAMAAEAVQRLGITRGCLVGDKQGDIEAAHANGMLAIAVTYGYGSPAEWAAADITVGSPAEVLKLLPTVAPSA